MNHQLPPIQHYPVNWINGMKISKQHLTGLDNAWNDHIRDAICINLTDYNYGILPPLPGSKIAFDLKRNEDHFQLSHCRAVTAGGIRIEITGSDNPIDLRYPISKLKAKYNLNYASQLNFYLFVVADPFSDARIPFDEPDQEESPPRQPFTLPGYKLEVVPDNELNLGEKFSNYFPIGKLFIEGTEVILSERYIPPCAAVGSHPDLLAGYKRFKQILEEVESSNKKIIRHIKTYGQRTSIHSNVFLLSIDVMSFLVNNMDHYRMILGKQPPIFMVEFFARFARIFKTSLLRLSEEQKILNYISNFTGLTPHDFHLILDDLIHHEYDHYNIIGSIDKIQKFVNFLPELFARFNDFVVSR